MKQGKKLDQRGMVAIIVTMIMMFVITLIVLGFSEVTRRNQREALDSQLGIQAYYAAETGVNDIANALKGGVVPSTLNSTTCAARVVNGVTLPRSLTSDSSVANTCLMVDSNPASLIADGIEKTTDSVQWDVKSLSGTPFGSLSFSWAPENSAGGACNKAVGSYPSADDWNCNFGLLRVDIVKAGVNPDAATLAANTATVYMQPTQSDKSASISFGGTTTAYQTSCPVNTSTNRCTVTVNMDLSAQQNEYYVRVTSLYRKATSVKVQGKTSLGIDQKFKDGQVVVDSTGRAQDQLKRIKVRIPLGQTSSTNAVFAAQSAGSICKDILYNDLTYDKKSCNGIWPSGVVQAAPAATQVLGSATATSSTSSAPTGSESGGGATNPTTPTSPTTPTAPAAKTCNIGYTAYNGARGQCYRLVSANSFMCKGVYLDGTPLYYDLGPSGVHCYAVRSYK